MRFKKIFQKVIAVSGGLLFFGCTHYYCKQFLKTLPEFIEADEQAKTLPAAAAKRDALFERLIELDKKAECVDLNSSAKEFGEQLKALGYFYVYDDVTQTRRFGKIKFVKKFVRNGIEINLYSYQPEPDYLRSFIQHNNIFLDSRIESLAELRCAAHRNTNGLRARLLTKSCELEKGSGSLSKAELEHEIFHALAATAELKLERADEELGAYLYSLIKAPSYNTLAELVFSEQARSDLYHGEAKLLLDEFEKLGLARAKLPDSTLEAVAEAARKVYLQRGYAIPLEE